MTSYGSSETRSPYYGTATYSTLSQSQTPMSPSRDSYTYSSETPVASSDSDGATSARNMRRVLLSPSGSADSYTYSEENSVEETAEVEATLNELDEEIDSTEAALTQWSRGPSSSFVSGSYTGTTPSRTSTSLTPYSMTEREHRVLSTISERTENMPSRPTSYLLAGGAQRPANPTPEAHRYSAQRGGAISPAPSHSRSSTDPGSDRGPAPPTGRRFGDLIAFFEDKTTTFSETSYSHSRATSAPGGYRSPSPLFTQSQSTPNLGTNTGYGVGTTTGYSSRPSSPAKSKAGSSVSSSASEPLSMSSLLAPPTRGPTSTSTGSRGIGTSTYMSPSEYTNTFTNTFTNSGSNTFTTSRNTGTQSSGVITPTNSSLRRPQTSPRSPLTSVRNIVAAWKERTPTLDKSGKPTRAAPTSTPRGEGLFSLRKRAERGENRLRGMALSGNLAAESSRNNHGHPSTPRSVRSGSSGIPPPFDMAELGAYARNSQEPLRIGLLWYLNVHSAPPFRWQRCEALLYPNMLLLSWIAPGGGRGVVTLDLLNCTEVRSVPSPTHSSAREDVGTMAAKTQAEEKETPALMELLCPFQLLYSDGVERLAAESARERVRWVSAIWEALDRSVTLPNRSEVGSPTGSIRTIRSMTSSSSVSGSGSGSASTVFLPPLHTIPDLDLHSLSGSSSPISLSRAPSFSAHHSRTTDDAAVSNQAFLYPGDPRVIGPSRSSSLRRTSSMTDLDEEFATAVSRARSARPGLGFGLSLVGGTLLGDGSPVTVSSGPRLGGDVRVTPPPSSRGGKSRPHSEMSDDAFFSAGSRTSSSDPNSNSSNFYSVTSTSSSGQDRTTTGLVTDGTMFGITSGGSNTEIVPSTLSYRRTESASLLGDSHDGSYSYTPTSPSRTSLSRSAEVRRRGFSSRGYTTYDETSDKENSGSYTPWTTTRSTLSSFTRSRSITPTPSSSNRSAVEELAQGETSRTSSGSEGYETAGTPSTASFKSLPTIPSESDYSTAELCKTEASTEYVTAEKCASDVSTDYITADVCKTEVSSEYITAEVCKSEPSTQFETASLCRTIPSEAESPFSIHVDIPIEADVPPIIPPVVSSPVVSLSDEQIEYIEETVVEENLREFEEYVEREESIEEDFEIIPENIPLPPSGSSPSLSASGSLESEQISVPAPSSVVHTNSVSLSFPSSITPQSDNTRLQSMTPVSSLTESSPLMVSDGLTPSAHGVPELSISTPSVRESMWAPETDMSFNSSVLHPSPSVQSVQMPEGLDTSFDTSFMRPSISPLTSLERLTPITETMSSSLSFSPSPVPHPALPPSISSPTSAPTPVIVSTSMESSSLSRTASSVSDVSIVSITLSPDVEQTSLVGERDVSEPSTEPSLLSSHRSLTPLPVPSPAMVPLPSSPAPSFSAASVSMSVSMSTPQSNNPSIHSDLDTIPTQPRSEILTHDINRLLQHIHELDQIRGQESQEISENVRAIRSELYELSNYLHQHEVSEVPPPVPHKDQSVGSASVVSRSVPVGPRLPPRRVPISLSPPPMRPASPSSFSSAISFLSSHHSDDYSLMEPESYPVHPSSPSWSSSSPSSPPSEMSPSSISSSSPSPGPSLSRSSSSPTQPPPSPTPSSASSSTARPVEGMSLINLRELLEQLREQTTALWDGQVSTNHMLDELRQQRPGPQDNDEIYERLRGIESLLERVIDQTQIHRQPMPMPQPQPQPPQPDISASVSESGSDPLADLESLRIRWEELSRSRREQIPIHMPTPVRTGPSLDDQLLELLGAPPPLPPAHPQLPPTLIPFTYQPAPRASRSRSTSPILMPDRPRTVPFTREEPVNFSPTRIRRVRTVRRPPPAGQRRPVSATEPSEMDTPRIIPARPPFAQADIGRQEERRPRVPPAYPVIPNLYATPPPARAPSAPANFDNADDPRVSASWYRERPSGPGGIVPPPGAFDGQPGTQPGGLAYVPMPAGPTVVQVPLFDTLMEILREHRLAQLATVDQQRELMRYMRGLNEWLERDVSDRQSELRGVSARVDQLRNELAQLGLGFRPDMPQPQHSSGPFIVPPVPPVTGPMGQPHLVSGQYPGGFVPLGPMQGGLVPPVIAQDRTPTPSYTPVIPSPVMGMPGVHHVPVVPDFSSYTPHHQVQGPDHYVYEPSAYTGGPSAYTGGVIPSPQSDSATYEPMPAVIINPPPPQIQQQQQQPITSTYFVPPSPSHSRSGSTTSTQQSYDHPPIPIPPHSGQDRQEGLADAPQPPVPAADLPHPSQARQESVSEPVTTVIINQAPPPAPGAVPGAVPEAVPGVVQGAAPGGTLPQAGVPGQYISPPPAIIINPPLQQIPGGPPIVIGRSPHSRPSSRGTSGGHPTVIVQRSRSSSSSPRQAPAHIVITSSGGRHPEHDTPYIVMQSPSHGSHVHLPEREYGDPGDRRPAPSELGFPDPGHVPSTSRPYEGHRRRHDRHDSRSYSPRRRDSRDYSPSGRPYRPSHRDRYYRDDRSRSRSYSPIGRRRRPRGHDYGRSRRDSYSPDDLGERDTGHGRRPRGSRRDDESRYDPEDVGERDTGHGRRLRRTRRDDESRYDPEDAGERDTGHGRRLRGSRRDDESRYDPEDAGERDTGHGRRPGGTRRDDESRHDPEDAGERDTGHGRRPGGTRRDDESRHDPEDVGERDTGHGRRPRGSRRDDESRYDPEDVEERDTGHGRRPGGTRRDDESRFDPEDAGERDTGHGRRPRGSRRDDESRYDPEDVEERDTGHGRRLRGSRRGEGSHYDPEDVEERDTGSRHPRGRASSPGFSEHDPDSPVLHRPPPSGHGDYVIRRPSTRLPPPPQSPQPPTIIRLGDPVHHPEIVVHSPPQSGVHPGDTYIPDFTPAVEHPPESEYAVPHPHHTGASHGIPPGSVFEDAPRHRPISETSVVPIPVPHVQTGPGDLAFEDALRDHHQRLDDAEKQLTEVAHQALENEDRREDMFRQNEDERERVFLGNETRREQESQQRADEIFRHLEERVAGIPLPPSGPAAAEPAPSIIESLHSAAQDAASRHASDILDTVRLEREELIREREAAEAERQRYQAEMEAERSRLDAEREARIQALEEELAKVRGELENEKQMRVTEEADMMNRERQEAQDRDDGLRNQLSDITNIVQEQRDTCDRENEARRARWEEDDTDKRMKNELLETLRSLASKLVDDADKKKEEEERAAAEGKPGIEEVMEELRRQSAEQRELLMNLSESWRSDSNRQHEETINAVRATAQEQVPFNVQGYLDEFSKALASEVRMLLGEVGKLREERRNMQHEIGFLLSMRAKYAPGGEFDPEWKPPATGPPADAPPPEPPAPPEEPAPARPAWRTVTQRTRKIRKRQEAAPPAQPPAPDPRQQVTSWATWHPDPALAPTPPSIEANLIVPDRGSPGLFGPRSPRDSYR